MWMNYEGYGLGWHWLGWLGMTFFWLIPILLMLAVLKYLMDGRSSKASDDDIMLDALAVLEEKYARGEINRDEYLQKREDLKRS